MNAIITCCNSSYFEKAKKSFINSFKFNQDSKHIIYLFGNKPEIIDAPEFISIKNIPENIEALNNPLLFAYKYWAILDSLNNGENKNIIYSDAANKINGCLSDIENFYKKNVLLSRYKDGQFLIKHWTTKKCIETLNGENFLNIPQIWAGFQAYKNTPQNITFVKNMLNLCIDESLSGPIPSISKPDGEGSECIQHRNDQSILSIESLKNNLYPEYDDTVTYTFGDFISMKYFYISQYDGDHLNLLNRKIFPRHYKYHSS